MSYVNTYYLSKTSDNGLELDSEEHRHTVFPLTYADWSVVDIVNSVIKKGRINFYKEKCPNMSENVMISSAIRMLLDRISESGYENDVDEFLCRYGYGIYGCSAKGITLKLIVNTREKI